MGIFDRNPNETAFVGGKKHWTDVIKNTGTGDLLIWKQPEEDFNTNSTLIVMPGESAFFVKSGQIEQVFDNGTYKLDTENYPFISRLRNAFSGGISTFNCVVYFTRSADSAEIFWGTSSPIQVRDKLLGIATKIRARGSYKVRIENPVVFLEKLVGSNIPFQTQEDLNGYFSNEFQSKIRAAITKELNETDEELLGIESKLDALTEGLEPSIQSILEPYGLRCVKFNIAALEIDDDELRRKYDEIGMEAIAKLRTAQAEAGVMGILGDNWGKLQAAHILGDLANNPGAGGTAAMGAGMGMGMAAGSVFGNMASQMFTPMNQNSQQFQTEQQVHSAPGRFTQKGTSNQTPPESNETDPYEVLSKMKKLLEAGLITQEQYDAKVEEIMSRI